MIEILRNEGNFVACRLSGTLSDADYQQLVAVIESAAGKGKLHLLLELLNLNGWDEQTRWADLRLDLKIAGQLERLALVGDKKWEAWLAKLGQPLTRAEIQFFGPSESADAWAWVQDGL